MKAGIAFLVLAYVLSQFYRAFLAVMAPVLASDIGATPQSLATASGVWFAVFAAMQIPVGIALDRIGPRLTASVLLLVGGAGGAALFATAADVRDVQIAMGLIGLGCSPVLMATYYIFARVYSAAIFATLAGVTIGIGSMGNLAAATPMAWAVEAVGWRETVWGLALVTGLVALALFLLIKDPAKPEGDQKGSLMDLLRIPALWLIFPLMFVGYAPSAGVRGLWVGPYVGDVFDLTVAEIGTVSLIMGVAMVVGSFAYGPLDRFFGTRKWVILIGNLLGAFACLAIWAVPESSILTATVLVAALGLFGASFPALVAHGRSFFPPHLVGRGVTLMNLFGIGGVGVMQFTSAPFFTALSGTMALPAAYGALFGVFGLAVLIGCAIYLFSEDRLD
ncbi:MFS transporter [Roseobacter sp. HKCC-CH-9208]|uniref:MFS transporter n=1 Tax=Roseobacter sp. HKCC-CH-9208 TaxID=3120339 RepID=UPI0030ED5750